MAIFQDQPINLEAVRGVSPERFVQRAERQQQAIVGDFLRMQQGIQAGIQEFEQKRAEKQNMQASLELLKELGAVEGLSDESIKAGIKNAGGATNFLKTITDMETAAQQSRLLEAQIAGAGTPKLSAFEEKRQALIRAGYSDKEATERAATGQRIQVGPAGKPSIDPTLLKQQIDADVNVLNEEIIPSINAAPFVNKMEELLNKEGIEGVITGQLAKPELFLKAIGADLGLNFPDVATTQEYIATAGRQVGSIIRLFGAGTGLSDADRQYAERIAGGDINVPIDALRRIVKAAKEASMGQIQRYNARVTRKYSEETGLTPEQVGFARASLIIPEEEMSLFQSPETNKVKDDPDKEVGDILNDLGIGIQ
jgi:hypothetical protein